MEHAAEENWQVLLSLFPGQWREQAVETGAVARLRGFSSAESLLRTLLLHIARGFSLARDGGSGQVSKSGQRIRCGAAQATTQQRGMAAIVVCGFIARERALRCRRMRQRAGSALSTARLSKNPA